MYTRGLWDMGDMCSVPPGSGVETPGGVPWGWRRWAAGLEPFIGGGEGI